MLKTGQRTAAAVLFTIFILAGAAFFSVKDIYHGLKRVFFEFPKFFVEVVILLL